MCRNSERSRHARHTFIGLLVICILIFAGVLSAAAGNKDKNKDNEASHVFSYSYDEVFQGTQEAIQRLGYFDTDKNKEKGTISGYGMFAGCKVPFEVQIETVSAKPETKVAITAKGGCRFIGKNSQNAVKTGILSELQKVLVTYR